MALVSFFGCANRIKTKPNNDKGGDDDKKCQAPLIFYSPHYRVALRKKVSGEKFPGGKLSTF
jgi:hypothetical protein